MNLALLFRYAEDQIVDKCPCPGYLVIDLYNQYGGLETVHASEVHREVSSLFKGDIEEYVTDTKNTRCCVCSAKTAIENQPLVFIPDRIAASFPFIGRPDFEAVISPENTAVMAADGTREETIEIRKVDIRQILADLLEVESRQRFPASPEPFPPHRVRRASL